MWTNIKNVETQDYKYLHIATHGFVNETNPDLSGLLFYPDTTSTEDGILASGEVYSDEGELSWKSFQEIPTIPTPPTDWIIYQFLMRGQVFAFNAILDEQLNLLEMWDEISGTQVWPIQ